MSYPFSGVQVRIPGGFTPFPSNLHPFPHPSHTIALLCHHNPTLHTLENPSFSYSRLIPFRVIPGVRGQYLVYPGTGDGAPGFPFHPYIPSLTEEMKSVLSFGCFMVQSIPRIWLHRQDNILPLHSLTRRPM